METDKPNITSNILLAKLEQIQLDSKATLYDK